MVIEFSPKNHGRRGLLLQSELEKKSWYCEDHGYQGPGNRGVSDLKKYQINIFLQNPKLVVPTTNL